MRVIAVILAAGRSDRFGSNKQLALIEGEAMIQRVTHAVSDAAPDAVVLVAGRDALAVHDAAAALFLVINERFDDGLGSSIAAAAKALGHATDALLICLGDQPLVPAGHYAALIDAWDGDPDTVIASGYGQSAGAPALFGRAWIETLAELDGDSGAKHLFDEAGEHLVVLPCEEAAVDIDTKEDYEALGSLP